MYKWIRLILGALFSIMAFWYLADQSSLFELFDLIPLTILLYGLFLIVFGFILPLFSDQDKLANIALICGVLSVLVIPVAWKWPGESFSFMIPLILFGIPLFSLSIILHLIAAFRKKNN